MSLEKEVRTDLLKDKNLMNYLTSNVVTAKQEKIHSEFVSTICNNLENIGINQPYDFFKEVRLRDFEKDKQEDEEPSNFRFINREVYRQSDIIVVNHELYIIEAKVIRTNNHKRKEGDKIRELRKQLTAGYSFFKRNFGIHPNLIGAYETLNSNHFNYFYQNPDGCCPKESDILQISC